MTPAIESAPDQGVGEPVPAGTADAAAKRIREEIGRAFKGSMAAVRRLRGRETTAPGELSHAQYSLLFGLADGAQRSAGELAQLADLAPATVTQMLDHLAAHGLVGAHALGDRQARRVHVAHRAGADGDRGAPVPDRAPLASGAVGVLRRRALTAAAVLDRLRALFEEFEGR